jgi:hypothetical protein
VLLVGLGVVDAGSIDGMIKRASVGVDGGSSCRYRVATDRVVRQSAVVLTIRPQVDVARAIVHDVCVGVRRRPGAAAPDDVRGIPIKGPEDHSSRDRSVDSLDRNPRQFERVHVELGDVLAYAFDHVAGCDRGTAAGPGRFSFSDLRGVSGFENLSQAGMDDGTSTIPDDHGSHS